MKKKNNKSLHLIFFSFHQNICPIIAHWHAKWLVTEFSQFGVNWILVLNAKSMEVKV